MELTQRFRRNNSIIFKEEGEGAFLFDPETGNLKYINASAKETFLMLNGENDVNQVTEHLIGLHPDIEANQIQRDVEGFLEELEANGFISSPDLG